MGAISATVQGRTEETAGGGALAWLRRSLPWAAWSLVLAPACIVPPRTRPPTGRPRGRVPESHLHFSGVDPGAADLPRAASGLAALAGPAVSAALAVVGCAWVRGRAAGEHVSCSPWCCGGSAATSGEESGTTAWSGLVLGTTLGWAIWMLVAGPRLLP